MYAGLTQELFVRKAHLTDSLSASKSRPVRDIYWVWKHRCPESDASCCIGRGCFASGSDASCLHFTDACQCRTGLNTCAWQKLILSFTGNIELTVAANFRLFMWTLTCSHCTPYAAYNVSLATQQIFDPQIEQETWIMMTQPNERSTLWADLIEPCLMAMAKDQRCPRKRKYAWS